MKYTKNLGLKLPEATDPVKVSDLNENFEELDKAAGAYEVGDLRSTLRTDLGDRWLLCNGEAFDPAEYPELAEVIPGGLAAMGTKAKSRTVGTSPGAAWGLGAYATDGINQLAAYSYAARAPSIPDLPSTNKIYWSGNNFKTVIQKTITPGYSYIRLFFANGHWIAFTGGVLGSAPYPIRFSYCCAQSVPASDFSSYTSLISTNTAILDVFHVEYIDGSYHAFCAIYDVSKAGGSNFRISAGVLTSASPDFQGAAFTIILPDAIGYDTARGSTIRFCRTEDKFAFFVFNSDYKLLNAAWSATPAGAYQQRTISADGQSAAAWMSAPLAVDGKIVWTRATISGSTYALSLAHLDDLESGTMGYVSLGESATNYFTSGLVDCGDGTYAFFPSGESYIYVGTGDILQASNWTRGSLSAAPIWTGGAGIAYAKDGGVSTSKSGGILDIPRAAVPTVSISNCYTYIKAK